MNKKIEKLIEDSYLTVIRTKGMENIKDGACIVTKEKLDNFAQEIIKKCLEIADVEHKMALEFQWDNDDTAKSIKDSIRNYFGVLK